MWMTSSVWLMVVTSDQAETPPARFWNNWILADEFDDRSIDEWMRKSFDCYLILHFDCCYRCVRLAEPQDPRFKSSETEIPARRQDAVYNYDWAPDSSLRRHWPWPLELAKVKCKYANGKNVYDFLSVGNSNVCHICHRLRDIRSPDSL